MNNKFLIFFTAMLFAITFASASLSITWATEPSDMYQGSNATAIVNISNTEASALTVNLSTSLSNITVNDSFTIAASTSVLRTVSVNTSTRTTTIGPNTFKVAATGLNSTGSSFSASIEKTINVNFRYCSVNSSTSLVYIEDITNDESIEDKDFKPLDNFNVKVKVRNAYNEKTYVVVETVLVKKSTIEDTEDELTQKISSDSSKTFSLNMTIPSDLSKGEYYLFVKAYEEDKSSNCDQRSIKLYVDRDEHEVIPQNVEITSPVECASTLNIAGSLINIGDNDEDRVRLDYSDDLKFSDSVVFDDVSTGDEKDFSFNFDIAKNATEKWNRLSLKIYYTYDEDSDSYDDSAVYNYYYNVSGNCFKEIRNMSFSALSQTAFVSEDTDISVALSNTGNVEQTYTLNASSSDFVIKSVSPSSISLPAGSTASIAIKLAPKEGVETGMHSLVLGVSYGGKSETKIISLNVQKESSTISRWYDYVKDKVSKISLLTALNIVLGIVIIVLFVKLVFFKPKASAKPVVQQAYKENIRKNFK